MPAVTVQVAQLQMDELLDRAVAGEEVVIVRGGTPAARLVPLAEEERRQYRGAEIEGASDRVR